MDEMEKKEERNVDVPVNPCRLKLKGEEQRAVACLEVVTLGWGRSLESPTLKTLSALHLELQAQQNTSKILPQISI